MKPALIICSTSQNALAKEAFPGSRIFKVANTPVDLQSRESANLWVFPLSLENLHRTLRMVNVGSTSLVTASVAGSQTSQAKLSGGLKDAIGVKVALNKKALGVVSAQISAFVGYPITLDWHQIVLLHRMLSLYQRTDFKPVERYIITLTIGDVEYTQSYASKVRAKRYVSWMEKDGVLTLTNEGPSTPESLEKVRSIGNLIDLCEGIKAETVIKEAVYLHLSGCISDPFTTMGDPILVYKAPARASSVFDALKARQEADPLTKIRAIVNVMGRDVFDSVRFSVKKYARHDRVFTRTAASFSVSLSKAGAAKPKGTDTQDLINLLSSGRVYSTCPEYDAAVATAALFSKGLIVNSPLFGLRPSPSALLIGVIVERMFRFLTDATRINQRLDLVEKGDVDVETYERILLAKLESLSGPECFADQSAPTTVKKYRPKKQKTRYDRDGSPIVVKKPSGDAGKSKANAGFRKNKNQDGIRIFSEEEIPKCGCNLPNTHERSPTLLSLNCKGVPFFVCLHCYGVQAVSIDKDRRIAPYAVLSLPGACYSCLEDGSIRTAYKEQAQGVEIMCSGCGTVQPDYFNHQTPQPSGRS